MRPLLESNMSSFLAKNMRDEQFKLACKALLNKGYDIARIPDSAIKRMNPQEAFKLKGKRGDLYFKFWFVGSKFAFCTWANTMIDIGFRWKKNERGTIIGDRIWVTKYIESNDAINQMTDCYVVAFDDMPKVDELRTTRSQAKKGSIAFLKPEEIRKMNLDRYKTKIAETGFSNGSEIDFIKRAFKQLKPLMTRPYSPMLLLVNEARMSYRDFSYLFNEVASFLEYANECHYDIVNADKKELAYHQRILKRNYNFIETTLDRIFKRDSYKFMVELCNNVQRKNNIYDATIGEIEKVFDDATIMKIVPAWIQLKSFIINDLPEINKVLAKFPDLSLSIDEANALFEIMDLFSNAIKPIFMQMQSFWFYIELYNTRPNDLNKDNDRIVSIDVVKTAINKSKTYIKVISNIV